MRSDRCLLVRTSEGVTERPSLADMRECTMPPARRSTGCLKLRPARLLAVNDEGSGDLDEREIAGRKGS
jgi:hypothetical protein